MVITLLYTIEFGIGQNCINKNNIVYFLHNFSFLISNYYNYIKENFKTQKLIQKNSLENYIWDDA